MTITRSITISLAAMLASTTAFAQDTSFTQRLSYGLTVVQSRPQGELARHVGLGYGANASLLVRLDDSGLWSIRGDIGGVQYGDASRDMTLGDPHVDGLKLKLSTTNYIMPMSLGLQLARSTGLVRPYVNAGVGLQVFVTDTQLRSESDFMWSGFANTTNRSDCVGSVMAGGGLYLVLPIRRRSVMIDAGLQYFDGARASYLVPSATNDPAAPSMTSVNSSAHLVTIKLGARLAW
jgi:hypothetical protein